MTSVSATCSRGIHAYLAEQHSYFRNKKLGISLISGIIGSGLLLGVNQFTSLDIPTPMMFVPLGIYYCYWLRRRNYVIKTKTI